MQPQNQPDGSRADGFKPKYRHFHPMDRVWVKNPFKHDVVFQVADEHNRPFRYRLPSEKVSELPGGAIATLGVKAIVDELIQNDKEDSMLMWDERIRRKHEDTVILRMKQTALVGDPSTPGEVNLQATTDEVAEPAVEAPAPPEEAFPGLNETTQPSVPVETSRDPLPAPAAEAIADVVSASLPASNVSVGANNAGHNDEG